MPSFLDPQFLVQTLGLIGIFAIVFAESGLFFGFFLPGDSLLFTAGLYASQGHLSIGMLLVGCAVCAVAGDGVGYSFGRRVGPSLFSRDDSFFFRKGHVEKARLFYEKYGVKTIIVARFVPIVRTFAPIIAGIAQMRYRTFLIYNVIGGVLWTTVMLLLGFFTGSFIPHAEKYIHIIAVGIIFLSILPIVFEWARSKWGKERPAM